jgi:Kef-type K+ transport system membrane component KefB
VTSGKRLVSSAIVGSLCATAALAIAILLFSQFGRTQGRILGTTGLIALFGLLALPAGVLFDQRRLRRLATAVVAGAGAGLALALAVVWSNDPPDALGKTTGTVTAFALASTQTAALAARRSGGDSQAVRRLFAASIALALVLAALMTAAVWGDIGNQVYYRVVAALAVADLLTVTLQPVLARMSAGAAPEVNRLRLLVEPGGECEVDIEAASFATAVERAVAAAERTGARVVRIERL